MEGHGRKFHILPSEPSLFPFLEFYQFFMCMVTYKKGHPAWLYAVAYIKN